MKNWAIALGLVVTAASWGCGRVSHMDRACQDCGAGGETSDGSPGKASPGKASPGKALPGTSAGGTSGMMGSVGDGSGGGAAAPSFAPFAPQCAHPLGFKSQCSFEETCRQIGCGDGLSLFGDDGCRHPCEEPNDCGKGERCRFTILASETCVGSLVEGCLLLQGNNCICEMTADCTYPDVCVDAARFPESEDCALAGTSCEDLRARQYTLNLPRAGDSDEKSRAIWACQVAIHERQVELSCPGVFAPECSESLEFASHCSFEDTCKVLGCGDGISEFGTDGCRRLCTTSADCGAGERCRHTLLVTSEEECITGGDLEGCHYEAGSCVCLQETSCEYPDVCVDAAKYPPAEDCNLAGASCTALSFLEGNVSGFVHNPGPDPDELPAATACLAAVKQKKSDLHCP